MIAKTALGEYGADSRGVINGSEIEAILQANDVEAIYKVSRWQVYRNRLIDRKVLSKEMISAIDFIEDLCRDSI